MLNETETISSEDFHIVISQGLNAENDITPNDIILHDNFPNPFNNNTAIRYLHDGKNSLSIYITDVKGRLIKIIHEGKKSRGMKNIYWDGTNSFGLEARSGMYFYTLEAEGFKKTKKMLLLK